MLTGVKDLDLAILNKLDDKDLVSVCKANKTIYETCQDQTFWLNRIMVKFPYLDLDLLRKYKKDRSWDQYYIHDLRTINKTNAANILYGYDNLNRIDRLHIALKMLPNHKISLNYAFIEAIRHQNLNTVKFLVSQGADIHYLSDLPIVVAIQFGNLEIVKYLVSLGVDFGSEEMNVAIRNNRQHIIDYFSK